MLTLYMCMLCNFKIYSNELLKNCPICDCKIEPVIDTENVYTDYQCSMCNLRICSIETKNLCPVCNSSLLIKGKHKTIEDCTNY